MKLILMGSCVSRDIFGPKFENGWNDLHIDMSFNRSSLISLNGEPFNIDVTANPHLNPFQRRSLSDDLNKTFYKYISRLKYDGHYLLLDFVDERFGLFLYDGKYASISNEFLASKLMDELRGKIIPRFSEETTRLWKENCLLFIEKVLDVFDPEHIILHRASGWRDTLMEMIFLNFQTWMKSENRTICCRPIVNILKNNVLVFTFLI